MQISSKLTGSVGSSVLYQAQKQGIQNKKSVDVSTTDSVSLSERSLLMSEAVRVAQNTPDIRQSRVEDLRIQVANGTYQVDSHLVAQNLLREESDFLALQ